MMNEDQPIMKNPNLPKPNNILRLLLILFGIVLIVLLASFSVIYSQNYQDLKNKYASIKTAKSSDYLRLEFIEEAGNLSLAKVVEIDLAPSAAVAKPEDGYQVETKIDNQTFFQSYIHKTQEPLFAVVPQNGQRILVTDVKSGSTILDLDYTEIKKTASREISSRPTLRRNIARLAFSQTVEKTISFFKNLFSREKPKTTIQVLPPQLDALVSSIQEPKILAANSQMAIWYNPETQSFLVKILTSDTESVKNRALDWFRGLGVENTSEIKIEFVEIAGAIVNPQTGKIKP